MGYKFKNSDYKCNEKIILCFGEDNCSEAVKKLKELNLFNSKIKEIYTLETLNESVEKNIYVGFGNEATDEEIRQSFATAIKKAKAMKYGEYTFCFDDNNKSLDSVKRIVRLLAEACELTLYKFKGYKSDTKDNATENNITFVSNYIEEELIDSLNEGLNIANGVNLARDLGNIPANIMTPQEFSKQAISCGEKYNFSVEIFDKAILEEKGFKSLLAVGQGSHNEPNLAILKYNGAGESGYTAVIGKGVTFDAGGYNLKDSTGITTMKVDMCGGADALGLMCAVASNKLNTNLICLIPLCENLIGADAILPGSVIGTLSGKTVEITNTDAEGRLIMADALYYAASLENVNKIVDIATLTGATAMAFAGVCSSVMTNDQEYYELLNSASKECNEKVWQLPLFDEYKERVVSSIADLRNSGPTRAAGSIVAGMFLKEFVCNKSWLHIDIAGSAVAGVEKNYNPAGVTGYGVRLLYNLLKVSK